MQHAPSVRIPPIRISTGLKNLERSTVMQAVLLAVITLLALAMRFFRLGDWSLWIDEAYNIGYAQEIWSNPDAQRPLSLILSRFAIDLYGISHWSVRLVPALIGMITIPLLYVPIRKLFGAFVGLLSMLLLALSPWHLYWSQNARFYTALLLFYNLALFACYYWMERDRFSLLFLTIVLWLLALNERMVAGFLAPVVLVYLLALLAFKVEKPAAWNRRNLLILVAPAAVLGFLFLVFMTVTTGQVPYLATFIRYFVGYNQNPIRLVLGVVYDIGLPLFLMAGFGGLIVLKWKSRPGLLLLSAAVVPVALLVLISPFTQTFSRYVFITLPAWIILAAVAVRELIFETHRYARLAAIGVLVILLADPFSQNMLYYFYQNGNREDWRGAYAQVQALQQAGDQVVTTRTPIGRFYTGRKDVVWTQGVYPKDIIEKNQRTWFVIDNRTGFIAPELQEWLEEETRLVGVHDVYIPGKLMEMRVYLYDPLD